MRSVEEIKAALPKTKFYFPGSDSGIVRFKLKSTTHRLKIRVVFTWFDGVDMVHAMYRQTTPTLEEMEELKRLFFKPEEWDKCVIKENPYNKHSMILYRPQDGAFDGT